MKAWHNVTARRKKHISLILLYMGWQHSVEWMKNKRKGVQIRVYSRRLTREALINTFFLLLGQIINGLNVHAYSYCTGICRAQGHLIRTIETDTFANKIKHGVCYRTALPECSLWNIRKLCHLQCKSLIYFATVMLWWHHMGDETDLTSDCCEWF